MALDWMKPPTKRYEYILPQEVQKARDYICELASQHAFYAVCNKSKLYSLSKSQIELAAKMACEEARDNTKALQLTNDFDMFVKIATPIYTLTFGQNQD